jgi:sigma-B regulation protein RsbU (phosphoserine phosphatase)
VSSPSLNLRTLGHHKTRVLLVDDQAMVAEAVRRMLKSAPDIEFHACQDPQKALARANEVKPTVILLDLVMPDIDGLTLLKFMRANEATREVPVIVLSSKDDAAIKADAFEHGANDYIVKLPDPIELIARIRHHSKGYIAQLERNEAYAALEESQRALASELAQAAAFVRSLLPAPSTKGVETDWRFIPSAQLGGDAFGYHWLDDDHFAIFLLDVSGHGVKSALLSMSAMNALRTRTLLDVDFRDPSAVLSALSAAFQMTEYDDMYFTIWYGVYDRRSRTLRHANAGHPAAVLVTRQDGKVIADAIGHHGSFIGMVPKAQFVTSETVMPLAGNLFLFSDGCYEIEQPDGSMWSMEQLADTFTRHDPDAGLAPLADIEAVIRRVRGTERFEDDVSIVQVRFPAS